VVIVDTSVWIDYLRGIDNCETVWLDRELHRQRLGLTDLILCEILQGIQSRKAFSQTLAELAKLHVFHGGGAMIAVAAARNYQNLRQRGYTVRKTIDCLIATFCLEADHQLLHRDHDFDPFEKVLGLRVLDAVS
jgi:predicted nucleic acid-binding protein